MQVSWNISVLQKDNGDRGLSASYFKETEFQITTKTKRMWYMNFLNCELCVAPMEIHKSTGSNNGLLNV